MIDIIHSDVNRTNINPKYVVRTRSWVIDEGAVNMKVYMLDGNTITLQNEDIEQFQKQWQAYQALQ